MSTRVDEKSSVVKTSGVEEFNYRLPSETTLKHAVKLGIVDDKTILMDYWTA